MCGLGAVIGEVGGDDSHAISIFETDLRSRGPDDQRYVRYGEALLFHSRLSIIGLGEVGAQPIRSACGRFVMVFNGEVYNFRDLALKLPEFKKSDWESDTQVLVECFAKYGSKVFSMIRGMFACVIYDIERQSVCVARDFYGERPLYYSVGETGLVFCSYASTIARYLGTQGLSRNGIVDYFKYGNISPPFSAYEGIFALEPGCIMEFERCATGAFVQKAYASMRHLAVSEAAPRDISTSFRTAVERCLVSDVPVGIFLSGGIDSTAIFGAACELDTSLHALSLVFPGAPESEHKKLAQTEAFFGKTVEQVEVSEREFYDSFDEYFAEQDLPSIDGLNTFLVSRIAARTGIKVWLSGVGGDELFGGYHSLARARVVRGLPAFAKDFSVIPRLVTLIERFFNLNLRASKPLRLLEFLESEMSIAGVVDASRRIHSSKEVSRVLAHSPTKTDARGYCGLPEVSAGSHNSWIDAEVGLYMTPQLLRDIDNMGMANSLEIRAPFLDIDLLASVRSLSSDEFFNQRLGKEIFLNSVDIQLPGFLREGAKQGFSLPYRSWLLRRFDQLFEESVSQRSVRDLLDTAECRRLYAGFERGKVSWYTIWSIFSFSRWLTHVVYK